MSARLEAKSEHAPVPWVAILEDPARPRWWDINGADGSAIVSVLHGRGGAANAALIVRAVNSHEALVAALKRMVGWSVGSANLADVLSGKQHPEHGIDACALCEARAALALAEGKP